MIGFIGAGNMGGAIIGGIIKSGLYKPSEIIAADKNSAAIENLCEKFGIVKAADNAGAAKCEILVLAVKPQFLYSVIDEIKDIVPTDTVIVSIAAGQPLAQHSRAGR